MRKRARMRRTRRGMRGVGPLGFPWFDHGVIFVLTLGIGSPLAVMWLLSPRGEWHKIALAVTTYLVCIGTGYLILWLSRWLSRMYG